jgi:hypothetical protein
LTSKWAPYPRPSKSKLSPQPKTKKAFPIAREGFVVNLGASLDEFAEDIRAILEARIKNL